MVLSVSDVMVKLNSIRNSYPTESPVIIPHHTHNCASLQRQRRVISS